MDSHPCQTSWEPPHIHWWCILIWSWRQHVVVMLLKLWDELSIPHNEPGLQPNTHHHWLWHQCLHHDHDHATSVSCWPYWCSACICQPWPSTIPPWHSETCGLDELGSEHISTTLPWDVFIICPNLLQNIAPSAELDQCHFVKGSLGFPIEWRTLMVFISYTFMSGSLLILISLFFCDTHSTCMAFWIPTLAFSMQFWANPIKFSIFHTDNHNTVNMFNTLTLHHAHLWIWEHCCWCTISFPLWHCHFTGSLHHDITLWTP